MVPRSSRWRSLHEKLALEMYARLALEMFAAVT
jgi:hypothetical protein